MDQGREEEGFTGESPGKEQGWDKEVPAEEAQEVD
jgi:hypothetical protein